MKNIRAVIIVLALLSTGGCSANAADIGWAIGRIRIRAGTKQVDMGNDTFAQFYPSVDSDAGRAAGENYETRSIDEMKELFETEQIRSLFR